VYIALSSADKWGNKWGDIDLQRLYNLLREELAHPDDPWCIATMKWWDEFRLCPSSFLHILIICQ
jgi:hypothetical protein